MKTSQKGIERIAKNINAMDVYYQYIDQMDKYKFWSNLRRKLFSILSGLSDSEKELVKSLCNEEKAKYFGLI